MLCHSCSTIIPKLTEFTGAVVTPNCTIIAPCNSPANKIGITSNEPVIPTLIPNIPTGIAQNARNSGTNLLYSGIIFTRPTFISRPVSVSQISQLGNRGKTILLFAEYRTAKLTLSVSYPPILSSTTYQISQTSISEYSVCRACHRS